MDEVKSCPCFHTTPCHKRCTCVCPASSFGCRYCCTYGPPEQQKNKAKFLAKILEGKYPCGFCMEPTDHPSGFCSEKCFNEDQDKVIYRSHVCNILNKPSKAFPWYHLECTCCTPSKYFYPTFNQI